MTTRIDSIALSAGGTTASASWRQFVRIDGRTIWSASAFMDDLGDLIVTGDLAESSFSHWFDPMTGRWEARLHGYVYEYPLDTLDVTTGPFTQTTSIP